MDFRAFWTTVIIIIVVITIITILVASLLCFWYVFLFLIFLDYVFLHSSLIITYLHTGHRISCSSSGSDENCPFYADMHVHVCVTHLCGLKCMIISVSRICRSEKPRVNKWYIFWWFCSILSLVLFKINATYTAFF